ncbi:MAG: LpxI family protein, partial [Alphaproteobacteria bacterium]|nr:LpxI family protein [Alphaproteobacteria bacterium]
MRLVAKLGILAGRGELPGLIAAACRARGQEFFVVAFEGHAEPRTVEGVPHAWFRLGAGGAALVRLKAEGVTELVMAGGIRRPSLAELRPDLRTARFFAKVGIGALGDDGLLSAIIRELEAEGFRVVGVDSVLADLVAPEGNLTRATPDTGALADIAHGFAVVRALGAVDVGQAAVVQQGLVLGVEAIEGTDALIARAGTLRREGPGGVLVKARKPGQERRADLPVVGPAT